MEGAGPHGIAAGDVLAGRYRALELIGSGGFGVVYRAVEIQRGREVAVKVLRPDLVGASDPTVRFSREAELARTLQHPNTVRLYDYGELEDGQPYIAWELLRGRTLDAELRASGPMSAPRVARIAAQVLKSLMEAHESGIVHRDVKPANIFLCSFAGEDDFVKVLDFGIAHIAGSAVTKSSGVLGSPAYMSPEQLGEQPVTRASDLYAVGLVMAELLSGQRVYGGDLAIQIAVAQLSKDAAPLPRAAVDSPLGAIIVRATQKAPAARFASAAEMLAAVEAAFGSRAGAIAPRPARARWLAWGAAVLAACVIAAGATTAVVRRHAPRPTSPAAARKAPRGEGITLAHVKEVLARRGEQFYATVTIAKDAAMQDDITHYTFVHGTAYRIVQIHRFEQAEVAAMYVTQMSAARDYHCDMRGLTVVSVQGPDGAAIAAEIWE